MESVFAIYDGEKFVPEKNIPFKKGQKVILTVLEDVKPEDETALMYNRAIESGSFNYLFEEGEVEYSINDCKEKY